MESCRSVKGVQRGSVFIIELEAELRLEKGREPQPPAGSASGVTSSAATGVLARGVSCGLEVLESSDNRSAARIFL